jgi:hypothetical protein
MRLPKATNRTIIIAAAVFALMVAVVTFLKKSPQEAPEPLPFLIAATPETPTPSPQPAKPKDAATTVLELFNPSDKVLTKQLNETNVIQQIEQLIATSLVLANCKLITNDEYKDTYNAAIVYAQHNKLAADAKLASNKVHAIAKSASATYALIYSRTKCEDPKLVTIAAQLKNPRMHRLDDSKRIRIIFTSPARISSR